MRRTSVLSTTPSLLLAASALALLVCAGCADGSTPTSPTTAGSGGGGGQSGAGGAGGDDTGGPSSTTKASSSSGGDGDGDGGGGGGQGGETGSSSGGQGGEGGSAGPGGGSGGEGGGNECGVECPDGLHDVDNNPLTGECGCEYACEPTGSEDAIDEDFTDDNCDGGDGLVEQCVYVSASAGDDVNAGTRTLPMQTIGNAIARAVENGVPAVCLSGEDYFESVNVASGVSIYGGFDHTNADFPFRRTATATTRVVAEGTVFYADDIAVDTHLAGMTIEAASTGIPGESVYGVRLRTGAGRLYVRNNTIIVANASAGANGTDGSPHGQATAQTGTVGNPGLEESPWPASGGGGVAPGCVERGGDGGRGGYGTSGGQPGTAGNGGAAPGDQGTAPGGSCGSGGTGDPGDPGADGSAGGTGSGAPVSRANVGAAIFAPAAGGDGVAGTPGKGGGGAGGGGGSQHRQPESCLCLPPYCVGDNGGGGGCGGLGGNRGLGGLGGGGSFAVFATGGRLTVADNDITTGDGGNGGRGGNGTTGQLGGTGASGGLGGGNEDGCSNCGGNGGRGGDGGDGGVGGPGGGGAGGHSACLARTSSVVHEFTGNSCTTGSRGDGGLGGTNPVGGSAATGQDGVNGANIQLNPL